MVYEEFMKTLYWEGFKLHKVEDLFAKAHATAQMHEIHDRTDYCWLEAYPQDTSHHRVHHLIVNAKDNDGLDTAPRVLSVSAIRLQDGDVVITSSSRETVSLLYVQELGGREVFVNSSHRVVIRPKADTVYKLHPMLLAHMMARPGLRQVFRNELSHTMIWTGHYIWVAMRKLMVPELTDDQQRKLAGLIEQTGVLRANHRRASMLYEELCNAVLHEYLTKGNTGSSAVSKPESASEPEPKRKVWSVVGYYPDNDQCYNGEHMAPSARRAALDAIQQAEDNGAELVVVDVFPGKVVGGELGPTLIGDQEDLQRFEIRYIHPECKTHWEDIYVCACNGECPLCGTSDIEPVMYKDVDDDWTDEQNALWDAQIESFGGTGSIEF